MSRRVLGAVVAIALAGGCVNRTASKVVVGLGLVFVVVGAVGVEANDGTGAAEVESAGVLVTGVSVAVLGLIGWGVHSLLDDGASEAEDASEPEPLQARRSTRRMRAVPPEVLAACKEERRAERTVALQIADAGQRGHALQRIKPCVTVIETEAPAADPSAREDAWAITKHAAAAARAGDCMTVIADEDVVREIDAEFHATIFVRDVAIAGCLQPATP